MNDELCCFLFLFTHFGDGFVLVVLALLSITAIAYILVFWSVEFLTRFIYSR